jgi:uncharacterized delta-60 repeat protein
MFASGSSANAVAVQGDGKIVAVGACFVGLTQFCLARYNSDGSLDTSFDSDGKVTTAMNTDSFRSGSSVLAVAVQGDGKIVAAGVCFDGETTGGEMADFCVARYNGDGSLDTSFDSDGEVRTRIFGAERAAAIAIQGDGKIVAAGNCHVGSATANFCLARYNGDGSLDTSFDSDGTVRTAIGAGAAYASGVAVQSDGKIVAAGACGLALAPSGFCVARYNSDGSLDTSFDSDGTLTTVIADGSYAYAVAVQGDGKLVVVGSCAVAGVSEFCLARYNGDGSLDTSFGSGGTVTTAVSAGGDVPKAMALQSDGKIVVAGYCNNSPTTYQFCLARYDGDGTGPVDGIDDTLQPPGTPAGSFVDNTGNGLTTTGTVTSGSVTVTDAADPDGVVISAGAAGATLTVCPQPQTYALVLSPGASATVTCGSVTVKAVASGSVIVRIPGTDVSVTFAAGSSGTVESDGGISVTGASGDVTMTVSGANARVPAGDSTLLRRGTGNDLINGTSGNDLIFDAGGNNTINGKGGKDTIVAGTGNDTIDGGDGDDWIDAGAGNNTVKGGAGNDSITAGSGNDTIDGGDGHDTCNPGLGKNNVKKCEA